MSVHRRSSAVETLVISPFSVSLTLRSGHGDPSLFHLLRLELRISFRAEPEIEELEIRKHCKVNHEDIQEYHERVDDSIFVTSKVEVFLEKKPTSLRTLLLIKESLGLESSIGELKMASEAVPCAIAKNLTYIQAIQRCEKVVAVEECLGVRLARDVSRTLPLDRRQMDAILQK